MLFINNSMLTVYKGRPESTEGRIDIEVAVYDLLDRLGVEYERVDHAPAMTMEVCRAIDEAFGRIHLSDNKPLEVPEDGEPHAVVCKNLFLTNKQHSRLFLLMMPGDKKFLTKNLSAQINSARLSFADEVLLKEKLGLTPGSVSVFGLMQDHGGEVELLIDRDLLVCDHVGCHPCINTSSLRLRTSDLFERILPALHHEPTLVTL